MYCYIIDSDSAPRDMDLDILGLLETDLHVQLLLWLVERNQLTNYSGLYTDTGICES